MDAVAHIAKALRPTDRIARVITDTVSTSNLSGKRSINCTQRQVACGLLIHEGAKEDELNTHLHSHAICQEIPTYQRRQR